MLIERIGMGGDLDPFAAAVITERTALLAVTANILCWSWGMYFSAAASSENVLAPFFPPELEEGRLIAAYDDPSV